MSSDVQICNQALSLIGEGAITDLHQSSDSPLVLTCRLHFHPSRRFLLRAFDWTFARKVDTLSEITSVETPYGHAFSLPADYLKMVRLADCELAKQMTWTIIGQQIHCAQPKSLSILYISDFKEPAKFTQEFEDLLVLRLAAKIAYPLSSEVGLAKDLKREYEFASKDYAALNANEEEEIRYPGQNPEIDQLVHP